MKTQQCMILIDGSNFYYKLKSLNIHNLLDFNFREYASFLAGKDSLVKATYYVGAIRNAEKNEQGKKMQADQQRLFSALRKNGFTYELGYMLKNNGFYTEKGVDVHIAVDIVESACDKKCSRIILVSSDTDLIPAIKSAQKRGITVEYIGFSHQPSIALIKNCNESRILKIDDILRFTSTK